MLEEGVWFLKPAINIGDLVLGFKGILIIHHSFETCVEKDMMNFLTFKDIFFDCLALGFKFIFL